VKKRKGRKKGVLFDGLAAGAEGTELLAGELEVLGVNHVLNHNINKYL